MVSHDRSLPDHVYIVILAGGSGTRLWPKSRLTRPKQLAEFGALNNSCLLDQTLQRISGLVPPSRCILVTHQAQAQSTAEVAQDVWVTCWPSPKLRIRLRQSPLQPTTRGQG
jgi:mannose-1-phosphate guanylyltransferase